MRLEGTESKNNLPHKVATVGNRSALHKIRVAETGSDKGGTSTLLLRCSLYEKIKIITFLIICKSASSMQDEAETVAANGHIVPPSGASDMICILSIGRMMTELTPCSKALLEKILIAQLVKFPAFNGTPRFITVFIRALD